ncbi:MAG: hypothetical protein K2H17_08465, partial [Duncaniella sp.]|uniref:hypothetical protein n=1 Tax=Duncaniella sp. TaxID=2518496 RepID=UPI0023D6999B
QFSKRDTKAQVTLKILTHEIIKREKQQYHRLRKFWASMTLHFSHIARYAPSIQIHIHLKTFAQILTIVFKQPLSIHKGDQCIFLHRPAQRRRL